MTDFERLKAVYLEHWEAKPAHWDVHPMIRNGELAWLRCHDGPTGGAEGEHMRAFMTPAEHRLHIRMLRWLRKVAVAELAAMREPRVDDSRLH